MARAQIIEAGRCGQGVASRRPPPRATTRQPRGRARQRTQQFRRGLPLGCRAVGLRQADGMPHELQHERSVTLACTV
jgi:hypothetical protein